MLPCQVEYTVECVVVIRRATRLDAAEHLLAGHGTEESVNVFCHGSSLGVSQVFIRLLHGFNWRFFLTGFLTHGKGAFELAGCYDYLRLA